jgi:two-component system, cell cycle sensor histidine kinase and response regulator CckA
LVTTAQVTGIGLERLGALLETATEGFQIIGYDFRYLYVNDAVCRQGRRKRAELLGRTMMEVYPGIEETEMFGVLSGCLRERRSGRLENEFRFPDGARGWFELRMEPVEEGLLVLSADITNRKVLESQLHHSQKMEAVGRLAGGIAHDFNNIISVIMAYATILTSSLDEGDERLADVDEIERAARRAASLTRQLLTFSRQQVLEPRVLDLNEVVRGSEGMIARLLREDIQLTWGLDENLRRVFVDAGQIEQVLVNLVVNARDAIPSGGRILIETANIELDEAYAASHAGVLPGRYVMLAVTDTGTGMDPETQSRIFEPFFTTKPAGKGTGLGLATVYGIVRQCGGDIWVYSELGRGTTFKVYLPESATRQVVELPPPPLPEDLAGTEAILVVEDDAQVRSAACTLLRRFGYRVIGAQDAAEALELAGGPDPFHLLLTDVVMPGTSGIELARRFMAAHPQMRILYFSGYTEEVAITHGLLDKGVAFVQKPFTSESLARRVRQALDGPPPTLP